MFAQLRWGRLDFARRQGQFHGRGNLFQFAFNRMFNLGDQTVSIDLSIFDHLSDIIDELNTGVDLIESSEPIGGYTGFEDLAENHNHLLLCLPAVLFFNEIVTSQDTAGALPELGFERAQTEIPAIFGFVDLIAGVTP